MDLDADFLGQYGVDLVSVPVSLYYKKSANMALMYKNVVDKC